MNFKGLVSFLLASASIFSFISCSEDNSLKGVVIAVNDSEGGHFIDASSGKTLFEGKDFEEVSIFSEDLAAVKMDGKWGYVGKDGKVKIPCKYLKAGDFRNKKGKVTLEDGKTAYIDRKGDPAEESILERYSFHEGFASVESKTNRHWGFISENEDELPIPFAFAPLFSPRHSSSKLGSALGLSKRFIFERARSFHEGAAGVRVGGKWGFIDTKGNTLVDCTFEDVWDFSEGLAEVKMDGKWGFVDRSGKIVIPCIYDCGWEFKDGLAVVEVDGLYGVIDTAGRFIVPAQADEVAWSRW